MFNIAKLGKLALATLMSLSISQGLNAAERISDFSLIDHRGKFFQLSREVQNDAIVQFPAHHLGVINKNGHRDVIIGGHFCQAVAFGVSAGTNQVKTHFPGLELADEVLKVAQSPTHVAAVFVGNDDNGVILNLTHWQP